MHSCSLLVGGRNALDRETLGEKPSVCPRTLTAEEVRGIMLRYLFCVIALLGSVMAAQQGLAQQGRNNLWMGGFASWGGLPYGGTNLDFSTGAADVYYVNREMDFDRTVALITDSLGDLLFSSNGYYVANAAGDTMMNGTGLNPSFYTSQFPDGLRLGQAALILPSPSDADLFLLVHGTYDDPVLQSAMYLYLTTIDMGLNGGLGAVVSKNQVVIQDTLNIGKITAVKHANGRDWWVFCHKLHTNTFYRMLLTPDGLGSPETQDIGIVRPPDGGQVCFSPDGSRFAYYWGEHDLDIFDFDRCSGLLSNPVHVDIQDENSVGGVAFSPNSQVLYVSSLLDVYQFDMLAADIAASMVQIAEWDSFYSPSPPFATLFDIAQLAPDGKIYIGTGNSTFHLHVIDNPDIVGAGCNMIQHGLELPTYFQSSLPNHPNYHLGPLAGSPCDTLGLGVAEKPPQLDLSAYPNPSSGVFTLNYPAQAMAGELEVRVLNGKVVLSEPLPAWSTVQRVELSAQAAGMYHCVLRWAGHAASIRQVIEP